MRQPRDYQQRAIDAVRDAFKAGKRGVIIEAFTGAGKAFIIAHIAELVREKKGRILVLVNRDNLCEQLFESLRQQGLFPSMERGQDKASPMSEIVVGSIQTMQGDRLKKWNAEHWRMVITDEVHFGAAKTFRATLDYFRSAFHLGVTATVERHDKKGLWDGYEDIVFSMPLTAGIDEGWLVPLTFLELPVPITISDKDNSKKVFGEKEEEDVFSRDSYLPRLFAEASIHCGTKKALMFWPGCKASEAAALAFAEKGIESKHVDGYMSKSNIAEILEWFKTQGIKTLHNADLLSYGYDNPSIDCVGIMRLSRSLPMLKQRIGRGTRTFGADVDALPTSELRRASIAASPKPSCMILDLMLQLGEAQSSFASVGQLVTENKEEADYVRVKRNSAGIPIDLEGLRNLVKAKKSDDEKSLTKLAEDAANAAERKKLANGLPYYQHIINKFTHGKNRASDAQMRFLGKLGYTGPKDLSSQQAHLIIDLFQNHKKKLQLT
jgi:superfamily II DNA or RNA helicase